MKDLKGIVSLIGEHLKTLAEGNAVVSKPISVGDRHVLPLCELGLGLGGGGGVAYLGDTIGSSSIKLFDSGNWTGARPGPSNSCSGSGYGVLGVLGSGSIGSFLGGGRSDCRAARTGSLVGKGTYGPRRGCSSGWGSAGPGIA